MELKTLKINKIRPVAQVFYRLSRIEKKLNWLAIIPVCLALIINFSCWCMKLIKSIYFFADQSLHWTLLSRSLHYSAYQISLYKRCTFTFFLFLLTDNLSNIYCKRYHLPIVLFCPILLCWMACVIFIADFKRTIILILCIRDIFHNHPQLFISFSV